ncbi:MAG TPA: hypothetical protein VK828_20840 [Terriglobales bacterium]|jgi:hypothetical protein|nr:hypothetical protein [Terriglobales bacterium]
MHHRTLWGYTLFPVLTEFRFGGDTSAGKVASDAAKIAEFTWNSGEI